MEIIKNFGLDPFLLGAQIVNFLIVFYLLRRLLYKPVLTMLKNREARIREGLEKTEEARKLLEKTIEEEKIILKKAQNQANIFIEDAKNQALEISRQSEENSKKQAEMMLAEAKDQIARESKITEEKLTVYISDLAIQFLQKAIKEFFSEKQQEEIMTKALKGLKEKPN